MGTHTTDGGRRAHVLRAVRAAPAPIGVAELAEKLRVHPNTVRFHLTALERDGAVHRVGRDESAARKTGRGRPTLRYRVAPNTGADGERHYEMLAGILASGLAESERGRDLVERAGYSWGLRRSVQGGEDAQQAHGARDFQAAHDDCDAVTRLMGLLDETGFSPRRADTDTLELLNCPFRQTITDHGELICGIHAGLMRGALAGWDARVTVADLEPFASPGVCRATLTRARAA